MTEFPVGKQVRKTPGRLHQCQRTLQHLLEVGGDLAVQHCTRKAIMTHSTTQ